jgi:hypothetical protein
MIVVTSPGLRKSAGVGNTNIGHVPRHGGKFEHEGYRRATEFTEIEVRTANSFTYVITINRRMIEFVTGVLYVLIT